MRSARQLLRKYRSGADYCSSGPRVRRLIDWTPEDGDGQEWLAKLAAEGWVPEHRTGADTVVNGRRVRRFAMIRRDVTPGG